MFLLPGVPVPGVDHVVPLLVLRVVPVADQLGGGGPGVEESSAHHDLRRVTVTAGREHGACNTQHSVRSDT